MKEIGVNVMKRITSKSKVEEKLKKYNIGMVFDDNAFETMSIINFEAGELLCKSGQKSKYLFLILEGTCEVIPITEDGKQMMLQLIKKGDLCGDLEFFSGNSSSFEYVLDVCVITDTSVLAIPYDYIDRVLRKNAEFINFVCKKICDKVISNGKGFSGAYLYNAKERLIRYIAEASGGSKKLLFSSSEVALKLGMTTRHLRRLLQELINEGSIVKNYKLITIKDLDRFDINKL